MKTFFLFEQIKHQIINIQTTFLYETQTQNEHMKHDIFGPLQAPFNMACNMCDKME